MKIREETPSDIDVIRSITRAAFLSIEHSSQTESAIVDALREAGTLSISLVALENNEIVGHVAFSPVTIEGDNIGWFGLGPVSVLPDRQRKGIGTTLIEDGLRRISAMKAKGCVVLGDPNYYARFGFEAGPELFLDGVPPEYFMRRAFEGDMPCGRVDYHKSFDAK
ncbi:MAG: N-acetyltransferase [Sneathiella sp.]